MDKTRPVAKVPIRLPDSPKAALSLSGLLALFFVAGPLFSQTISGQLVDEITGRPISGGFVILLDDSSVQHTRTLTDAQGRFTLEAPGAGRYRLKSAVIGIKSKISEPIGVAVDETVGFTFVIPAISITLPTLVIRGEKACRTRREASVAATALWEEAQKALDAVAWTEGQGTLRHRLVQYQRLLDPHSLRSQDSLRWSQSGMYRASPFRTLPPDELATTGFIKRTGKHEHYYYGPDANVLLSNEFASLHCFSVQRHEDARLIGLAFKPITGRKVPDIEGVLWLDQRSAQLQYLEFRYTGVPPGSRSEHVGGRVEFERLPDGPWMVRKWWIRMPVMGVRQTKFSDFTSEAYLVAVKEMGGWVSEIHALDGKLIQRGLATSLIGKVVDMETAEPLPGVTVILLGTGYRARTDSRGRFFLHGLAEDTYEISFPREFLDSIGFVPPKQKATLELGRTASVGIAIPSARAVWARLCPSSTMADSVGMLSGFIRDAASGKALREAEITLSARLPGTRHAPGKLVEIWAMSDWAGYYAACGVPQRQVVTVQVRLPGWSGVATSTQLSAGDVVQLNFELTELAAKPQPN